VVMVDDIDLHLHPKWQRIVVPRLAKAFPKLQFILTTHSPLVAGTVHAANVRVIGKNQVHQFDERLHGLSVDQILSSPYFGYTKPRSDAAEKKLKELLQGPIDEGDAGPALKFLKALAGDDPAAT
jgi:predicted ATP-binding protein involved in virulence